MQDIVWETNSRRYRTKVVLHCTYCLLYRYKERRYLPGFRYLFSLFVLDIQNKGLIQKHNKLAKLMNSWIWRLRSEHRRTWVTSEETDVETARIPLAFKDIGNFGYRYNFYFKNSVCARKKLDMYQSLKINKTGITLIVDGFIGW